MNGDVRESVPVARRRELLAAALDFARATREAVHAVVAEGFDVEIKDDASPVTTADREAEQAFRRRVAGQFPEAGIIGEEFGATRPEAEYQWIIDPIDGTDEFVRHMPVYGTIIGLHYRGAPLVGIIDHPALDLCVHAAFGLGTFCNGERVAVMESGSGIGDGAERVGLPSRYSFTRRSRDGGVFDNLVRAHPRVRIYHTCYSHTCAALGALDASVEWTSPVWDLAAARVLVEEAGGKYVEVGSTEHPDLGTVASVVFGKPAVVERLLSTLRGGDGPSD